MTTPWISSIHTIIDGEAVRAATPNRPLTQLAQRTQYLYEQLLSSGLGESLVARSVNLATNSVAGTPVYFDRLSGEWKPARAEIALTPGNYGWAADSSYVQGFVISKIGSNSGDIGLSGKFRKTAHNIDWQTVIDDGVFTPGVYYLSALTGKISRTRSLLTVYFGTIDADGDIVFAPSVNGNLRDHIHYRVDLTSSLSADASTLGWAPAASFYDIDINPPVGAIYGYTVHLDLTLKNLFPPTPLIAQALYRDGKLLKDDGSVYVLNADGIWWMSATDSPAVPGGNTAAPLALWLTRSETSTPIVSSLNPAESAEALPVVFRSPSGITTNSGDLVAGIESFYPFSTEDEPDETGSALRSVDGIYVKRGKVVTKLVAGDNISLQASQGDQAGAYGVVIISAGKAISISGPATLAALDNANEGYYNHVSVTSFPRNRIAKIRYQINVPYNISAGSSCKLRFDFAGTTTAAANFSVGATVIQPGVDIPTGDTALTNMVVNLVNKRMVTAETATITVNPGDVASFILSNTTTYLFDVSILKVTYVIN